ncbi:MAG: TetM/TetW/TetO/TetS family tetracycline resistance ribosomal protection protein [Clostridia bacterium]|nr:TetM/TetW/TetO/TetS family tetracycline resistance ribosomal protection protein [Clostridia bacterium]
MKRLVFGILAHVDSGKTTLSEGLLYTSGNIRKLGRVDHGDAFLDTFDIERQRGITIFSKQAMLESDDCQITLLDTPGHVDFSSETERTLSVLDYAVLVISGTDGVQAHTETLWELLKSHNIPVFVFVNKMDLAAMAPSVLLNDLRKRLGEGFVNFSAPQEEVDEEISLCDDGLIEQYLEHGFIEEEKKAQLIAGRRLFPVFFGSALKLDGVEQLLTAMQELTLMPEYPEEFGARVFKISRDEKDERLTYLKVTGGSLRVKDTVKGGEGDDEWEEKVNQLRIYSGVRFRPEQVAGPGAVVAATGLTHTYPGMGLGCEHEGQAPELRPVLTYRLIYPEKYDHHTVLGYMKRLQEEDPQLKVEWNEQLREIHLRLMGEIQLEVLRQMMKSRFDIDVEFGEGNIVYRETITEPVEGIGHYEPLRHYAEVRLLLQPGERGSGLTFESACSTNQLDLNWQRLIMTHLAEKEHAGILTGSPITDIKITLLAGRAHLKHTEGGDFRQATYRAVRQGLRRSKSILLEPWYAFKIEVPSESLGRVISDVQRMSGTFEPADMEGSTAIVKGTAPVSEMKDYQKELTSFTGGRGRITLRVKGYEPCHNESEVVGAIGYDPDRDTLNPCDSVFCEHGAGHVVPWYKVPSEAHTESPLKTRLNKVEVTGQAQSNTRRSQLVPFSAEEEKVLAEIFQRTYGTNVKRNTFAPVRKPARVELKDTPVAVPDKGKDYLLVDGYNIIFAWDDLKKLADTDLEAARQVLLDTLINYRGYRGGEVILVFDAYKVKGGVEKVEEIDGVWLVYTREKETADMYIERTTYDIARRNRVRVATSDNLEQIIILGHGAVRVSASEFRSEVEQINKHIRDVLDKQKPIKPGGNSIDMTALAKALEDAKSKKD